MDLEKCSDEFVRQIDRQYGIYNSFTYYALYFDYDINIDQEALISNVEGE